MGAPGETDPGPDADAGRKDDRIWDALHRADRLRISVRGLDGLVAHADAEPGQSNGDVVRAFTELHRDQRVGEHVRPQPRRRPDGSRDAHDVAAAALAPLPPAGVPPRAAASAFSAPPVPRHTAAPAARAGWAARAESWLPDLGAVAVACGALVAPWSWLLVVVAAAAAVVTTAWLEAGVSAARLPWHAVCRGASLLHPRSLVWAPVLAARTVLVAIALPAALAALVWVLEEGTSGTAAAARAGAWEHGFRVAAALVCLMVVGGVGDGRRRRADALRRRTRGWADGQVAAVAAGCVAVVLLLALAAPRPADVLFRGSDGLGWLPAFARERAELVRDDIVGAELDAVTSCLSQHTATVWTASHTAGNPPGEVDVARLSASDQRFGGLIDAATAAVAAHNQLAPWVETVEIAWGDRVLLRTDRAALPPGRPVADGAVLDAATDGDQGWLSRTPVIDRSTALRCSAGPVL